MKQVLIALLFVILPPASTVVAAQRVAAYRTPKLIVAIAVDQFRYDYTTRFRARYTSGLSRMLSEGAVYIDAHQDHFPTVTATGHATYLTGSIPATSGIIGNEWYDRNAGKVITSVEDADTTLLGADSKSKGSSPHNLVVSSLGDELKISNRGASKVIGISMKDRAAILPAGRMADAAYWIDNTGTVVSSTWYQPQLPDWIKQFNEKKIALKSLGAKWFAVGSNPTSDKPLMVLPAAPSKAYFTQWGETPYANEMVEELAEQVMINEKLGRNGVTDVLTVSFSANDHLGHAVGPDALEVEDMSVRTDRILGKLLDAAVKQVGGKQNVLVILTADHGVASVPEVNISRKMPGGRVDKQAYLDTVETALRNKFGKGKWVIATQESGFYLNYELIESKNLKHSDVEDEVASVVIKLPYVARVYTRTQLLRHEAAQSQIDEYMARAFYPQRGPDVLVVIKPYYLFDKEGTSHGSPYNYDSHVPLLFWGGGIRAGVYSETVGISDVAPTLAAIEHIQAPSGSVGHILPEVAAPFLSQSVVQSSGQRQH